MDREFISNLLIEESFAYGFTIAFWGSGMVLLGQYEALHFPDVTAYVTGAVTGFGLLALIVFDSPVDDVEGTGSPTFVVLAGIHYVAGLVPVLATNMLAVLGLGKLLTVFLSGMAVSTLYNASVAFEEVASEAAANLHDRFD